jgi:uncharacterized protein YciI
LLSQQTHAPDTALIRKLGADVKGMKQNIMAFLLEGPNRNQSPEETERTNKGHLDNIGKMVDMCKMVLAGPFMDEGKLRGIYIFDVISLEEARILTKKDPLVKAERFVMKLHTWYG